MAADYGDCGTRTLVATGPMFKLVDLSLTKLIPFVGRTRLEFRVEMLNAFNWVNYTPVAGLGSNPNSYEVTALHSRSAGSTNIDSARIVQLVTRFTW